MSIPLATAQRLRTSVPMDRIPPQHRAEWSRWCAQVDRMAQAARDGGLGLPWLIALPLWFGAASLTAAGGWIAYKTAQKTGEIIDESGSAVAAAASAVSAMVPLLLVLWLLSRKR